MAGIGYLTLYLLHLLNLPLQTSGSVLQLPVGSVRLVTGHAFVLLVVVVLLMVMMALMLLTVMVMVMVTVTVLLSPPETCPPLPMGAGSPLL